MPNDLNIMADLHEIIDLGPLTDNRIAVGATINRRIGTNIHIILQDHTTNLRHLEMPLRPHGESKSVLSDSGAGMDDDAIADQRMNNRGMRPHRTITPDPHARPDHRIGGNDGSTADFRARANDHAGINNHAGFKPRIRMDKAARRNPPWVENRLGAAAQPETSGPPPWQNAR